MAADKVQIVICIQACEFEIVYTQTANGLFIDSTAFTFTRSKVNTIENNNNYWVFSCECTQSHANSFHLQLVQSIQSIRIQFVLIRSYFILFVVSLYFYEHIEMVYFRKENENELEPFAYLSIKKKVIIFFQTKV